MKKRMLACLLVLCMVMTMAPTVAFAADAGLTQTVEQQDVGGLPAGDGSDSNDGNDVESEGQTGLTKGDTSKNGEIPKDGEEPEIALLSEPKAATESVAEVDGVGYATLADAIAAVEADNATVTLKKSVDLSGNLAVTNGHSFTLDLADNTLTLTRMNIGSAFVTVKNGTIKGDVALTASSEDKEYNSFTLASDAKIEAKEYGIIVFQDESGAENYGTTVNVNGTISGNGGSSLWVLGNIKTDLETAVYPVEVNVGSTAVMENKNTESTSLQMAGACVVTIEDGAQITGGTAVEVRAGTLIVNGGEFIATGTPTANPNGSGTSTSGAAIAVVQHTTNLPISVEIKNATLKGANAIFENEVQPVAGDREPITIAVDSAKLEGDAKFGVSKTEIKKTEIAGNLSNEGRGSVTVSDGSTVTGSVTNTGEDDEQGDMLIQDSTVETAVTDTNVMIENSTVGSEFVENNFGDNVARIGGKMYATLADAINAAGEHDVITLVKDITLAVSEGTADKTGAINIDKTVTIDGAAHTITADSQTFLKDGNTGKYHMFNITGGNVTIRNMTLDGNGCARHGVNVWKANNSGSTPVVKLENVKIFNNTGYAAVCAGSELTVSGIETSGNVWGGLNADDTGSSASGAKITVERGTINEANSVYVENSEKSESAGIKVVIEGGTFKGTVAIAQKDEQDVTGAELAVQGGSFSHSVSKYADDTLKFEVKKEGVFTYYETKEDALEAVQNGGEVTDISGNSDVQLELHTITFDYNNGDAGDHVVAAQGDSIKLPDASRSGYRFRGWENGDGKNYDAGEKYTVTKDETLTAQWKKKSSGGSSSGSSSSDDKFDIDKPSKIENGSISISDKRAEKGDTVTITVKPDKGYVLDELTVFDEDGDAIKLTEKSDNKFTFKMPAGDVEIEVSFKAEGAEWKNPFTDVSENDYFYDAVEWAVKKEITSGITADLFAPHMACSRAQMVTFLWRAAGSPAVQNAVNPFADVAADAYYHDAVLWAVEQGITSGVSATSFAPDAAVTRGQTVTFLYRAAGKSAVSGTNAFADVAADAFYADAVQWAVSEGVTSGTSQTSFAPNDACTRGQIVTFLYRAK